MGKRKRTYNTQLIKRTETYSIYEISILYNIHKATVRHWLKEGLIRIDEKRPIFVHGSDLYEFLKERQKKRKRKCKPDELFCMKCKYARKPKEMKVVIEEQSLKISRIKCICSECGTIMYKSFSAKNRKQLSPNFKIIKTHHKNILQSGDSVTNAHLNEESL